MPACACLRACVCVSVEGNEEKKSRLSKYNDDCNRISRLLTLFEQLCSPFIYDLQREETLSKCHQLSRIGNFRFSLSGVKRASLCISAWNRCLRSGSTSTRSSRAFAKLSATRRRTCAPKSNIFLSMKGPVQEGNSSFLEVLESVGHFCAGRRFS